MEALEFHLDSLFVIKLIKIFQFVTRFYERQKGISSSSLSSALSSCPASQQVPVCSKKEKKEKKNLLTRITNSFPFSPMKLT